MKSFEAIAQAAYQVFRTNLPGGDRRMLDWDQLKAETRSAWIAASRKMAEEIQQVL
ncbi:hypothetical protein [Comamonas sp.]|uniref:hypothetical protein n=1 Tax=Comamonas sp. TaxID=34028 RepID=UPI0028996776|nr:hypothetical protein [Comamonas sp.]